MRVLRRVKKVVTMIAKTTTPIGPPHFRIFRNNIINKATAFIIFPLAIFCTCGESPSMPAAKKGVLDIRGWDLPSRGPVKLTGEWEFYWKQELKPDDFQKQVAPKPDIYITIPGFWNGYTVKGEKLGSEGYATYRLRVLYGEQHKDIAFKINDVYMAYAFYVNNKPLGTAGIFAKNADAAKPELLSQVVTVSPDRKDLEIIINVSNFHYINGGLSRPILLGGEHEIRKIREKQLFFEFVLFGIILFIGIYHLLIFVIRRTDKSPLYLGISSIVASTYPLIFGERYFANLFPYLSWDIYIKIVIILFYISISTFAMYWHSLYPREFSKKILRAFQMIGIVFSLFVIITRPSVFFYSVKIFMVLILIGCIYMIYVLIISTIKKREGALIFLVGLLALFFAILNDTLYYNRVVSTGQCIPLGIFIFLLSQSIMLSIRFVKSFASVERLSTELKNKSDDLTNMNVQLEEKVRERTKNLEKTQEEMKTLLKVFGEMNDNLFQTTRDLEIAHKTMRQDMEMAASVQTKYFPAEPPKTKNWDMAFIMKPYSIISGDLYDFYVDGDDLLGLSLFDVSGHGAASGLITMIAKSISHRNFTANRRAGLNVIMKMINAELIREVGNVGNFITGILLRFAKNGIDYVNAGHPDLLIRRRDTGRVEPGGKGREDFKGHFLGFPYFSSNDYGVLTLDMHSGDSLLLFSDSLVETLNENEKQYGNKNLAESFARISPAASAREQLQSIMNDFFDYLSNSAIADDLTAILIKKE
jgi:serine phosphatase RsbU (regulator of sigma subunit)